MAGPCGRKRRVCRRAPDVDGDLERPPCPDPSTYCALPDALLLAHVVRTKLLPARLRIIFGRRRVLRWSFPLLSRDDERTVYGPRHAPGHSFNFIYAPHMGKEERDEMSESQDFPFFYAYPSTYYS